MTCTDGRRWTSCRQMACKRSAVRARLAPLVRSLIRTVRTASTAGKYSNGGRVGRRTCVRIGHLRRPGLLAGHRVRALNRRWPACHLRKSQSRCSRDSCCLITTGPPGEPFPPVTVAAFASSPVARWRSGPLPGTGPRWAGPLFADGRLGARARHVAPRVSVRRWADGALRRSGAGLRRGAAPRACRRAGAPREKTQCDAARRTWPAAGGQEAAA